MHDLLRWMYRGHRPNRVAQFLNRQSFAFQSSRLAPKYLAGLEVIGRKSGRIVSLPVVIASVAGRRYLVSMLGNDAQWVHNVRAANGRAWLRHGGRVAVRLVEVPVAQRAPILKEYLRCAPGARPHMRVNKDAPLAEFAAVAAEYPAFEIVPDTPAETA